MYISIDNLKLYNIYAIIIFFFQILGRDFKVLKEEKSFARYMYLLSSEISNIHVKRSVFTVQPLEALRGANISIPRTKFNRNYSIKAYDNSMPFKIHFNSKTVPINMNLISFKAFGKLEVIKLNFQLNKNDHVILNIVFKY